MSVKLKSNNTGTFTKQDAVSFDASLWAPTNGTINWNNYPLQVPYSETDVYHTQLTHTPGSVNDIGWTIRIGKGGHIYYIDMDGLGQIICPQRNMSPWNDDCMTATVFSSADHNIDPEIGGNKSYGNGYVHGSGMYIKPEIDTLNNKPFYSPILAEQFDSNDRSYTIVNWGLVPTPSVNRSDVLFYSRYRDMGNGVIETTFYYYNFGDRVYTFAETPWFAFRSSKFPNMVQGINGTSSFNINNKNFGDGPISRTCGWGAGTVDPTDPNSLTCALVWGSNPTGFGVNFGFVSRGERDMMLIAPSHSVLNMPRGTGVCYRRYVVLGKLSNVAQICEELNKNAIVKTSVVFNQTFSGKLPVYLNNITGQDILTLEKPNSASLPVIHTYAAPVSGSIPLLLIKNTVTSQYYITTDPYAICNKIPFTNPYAPDNPKFETYQNRYIYQPYDGQTDWVSLLGFVSPLSGNVKQDHVLLSTQLTGTSVKFLSGEFLNYDNIEVPV